MAIANNSLRVTELNFQQIKDNLTTFLKSKSEFADFDFTGSTLSTILDVLAYNSYYNAYYLNMLANEMYIDSSVVRESTSSLAKALNYLPRSARSSHASIIVNFVPGDSPNQIIIPKYSRFKTSIDGVNYEFTTAQDYTITPVAGSYSREIDIYEGVVLSYNFTFTAGQQPYFKIPLENLDSSSITVYVRENSGSTDRIFYTLVSDITEVDSNSKVYYLQEDMDGFYQVYFGDGVLGKALSSGNVVTVTVRECSGSAPNGAVSFETVGYTGQNSSTPTTRYTATITSVTEAATEGQEKETIESIKFNAPRSYESQNRLVTETDYHQFLMNNFSDIQSISVWGGEENDPPYYGKVILSIKPTGGFLISQNRKEQIIATMMKYNPMSIDVLIVDPSFVYIHTETRITYASTSSILTADQIMNKVSTAIQNFEDTKLGVFGNSFRYSKYVTAIDNADSAIESNDTDIFFEKRFVPTLNSNLSYKVDFKTAINHPFDGYIGAISSTKFTLSISDEELFIDDDGLGKIRLYYLDPINKIYVNTNAGSVDYVNGVIILDSFIFESYDGTEVIVRIEPDAKDLTPTRTQILLLSFPSVTLFDRSTSIITQVSTVDVVGNDSPIKTDGVLNTVLI
jgi:hypothetical protein